MEHDSVHSGSPEAAAPQGLPPFEDASEAMANAIGRDPRHVLIPSELVEVEILHSERERRRLLQADLLTLSAGGCCFIVFHRLELSCGEHGLIRRLSADDAQEPPRRFEVRWVQDLGEMLAIGGQYIDG